MPGLRAGVGVDAVRVGGGDQPADRGDGAEDGRGRHRGTEPAAAAEHQHGPDGRHGQALVLLDQQQRQRPACGRPPPSVGQRGHGAGGERHREGHLVDVEEHGGPQPPGHPVGGADQRAAHLAEPAGGRGRDRQDGQGEQARLRDEQGAGPGEEPVHRGEQRHDRAEVVAEEADAGALERRDGCAARRVAAHPLFEDAQVEAGGLHPVVADERDGRPECEQHRGGAGPAEQPDGRTERRAERHTAGDGNGCGDARAANRGGGGGHGGDARKTALSGA